MMKYISICILIGFLFFSCGSPESEEAATEETTMEEAENTTEEEPTPAVAVMHAVESWQEWKKHYDADKDSRQEMGMETLGIFVSPEDQNYVTVFIKTPNHEKAKEFSNSAELKETMEKAGVLEEPRMLYMDIIRMPTRDYDQKYRMMVTHEVEDYEKWKEVFDQHAPERREAGLELIGIGRNHDNPDEISVMLAFDDMDSARLFAESQDLKEAMDEAGVIGSPTIYWYEVAPKN